MVKMWLEDLKLIIAKTKIRIQFCEKHGIGDSCMKEKHLLKKMERQLENMKLNDTS